MPNAPPAHDFADVPRGWYVFAGSRDVRDRPVSRNVPWGEVVVWRTGDGLAATGGRCWHMNADLGRGTTAGGRVVCPFHGWRFDVMGRCQDHPDARLPTYAVTESAGLIYVAPDPTPPYPVPTFGEALSFARPFVLDIACPYWLAGGNGFDVAHFRCAHDRRLVGKPRVTTPHPAARRIVSDFIVTGCDLRDRLLRLVAGGRVRLDATVWSGTLALVRSTFRRSVTFGLVELRPVGRDRTRVTVRIGVRRRAGARLLAAVRADFVRAFLEPDVALLAGARYYPERLCEADRALIDYFRWLAPVTRGALIPEAGSVGPTSDVVS